MLCCAINDRESLYELETEIETIYIEKKTNVLPMILVVMKSDLEHVITRQEIRQFVAKHKLDGYYITSAKVNNNCFEAFLRMVSLTIYKSVEKEVFEKLEMENVDTVSRKCIIS